MPYSDMHPSVTDVLVSEFLSELSVSTGLFYVPLRLGRMKNLVIYFTGQISFLQPSFRTVK